ncbi:L-aspartate oxidase [compost metagenome]
MIRTRESLLKAIREIERLERENSRMRFTNIITTAKLITVGALRRTESRGGHFRADCPAERPEWRRRTYLTLAEANRLSKELAETEPA